VFANSGENDHRPPLKAITTLFAIYQRGRSKEDIREQLKRHHDLTLE
jgi:hypothetical protein